MAILNFSEKVGLINQLFEIDKPDKLLNLKFELDKLFKYMNGSSESFYKNNQACWQFRQEIGSLNLLSAREKRLII